MKSSILLAIGSALAWAALAPVMCRAQAEIAPDHYEMTNVEALTQTTVDTPNGGSVQRQMSGRDEGSFDQSSGASKTQKRLLGAILLDASLLLMLFVGSFIETRRRGSVHRDTRRMSTMQRS